MAGPIQRFLGDDHARLEGLLVRATTAADRIDLAAYGELRAGLLRHIAMEEKVLFVDARQRRHGERLPITLQLHADHAALAALLVPPPTHALIATLHGVLDEHNPLEEGPGGLYELCEQLAGPEVDELVARMRSLPEVRVAQHVEEPRVYEAIARRLAARVRAPNAPPGPTS